MVGPLNPTTFAQILSSEEQPTAAGGAFSTWEWVCLVSGCFTQSTEVIDILDRRSIVLTPTRNWHLAGRAAGSGLQRHSPLLLLDCNPFRIRCPPSTHTLYFERPHRQYHQCQRLHPLRVMACWSVQAVSHLQIQPIRSLSSLSNALPFHDATNLQYKHTNRATILNRARYCCIPYQFSPRNLAIANRSKTVANREQTETGWESKRHCKEAVSAMHHCAPALLCGC